MFAWLKDMLLHSKEILYLETLLLGKLNTFPLQKICIVWLDTVTQVIKLAFLQTRVFLLYLCLLTFLFQRLYSLASIPQISETWSAEGLYNNAADWDGSLSLTLVHLLGEDIFMKGCSLQDIEA